jgi:hypothetical protein
MNWITNHPKPLKGMWPRRKNAEYFEGEPKGTDKYSSEFLARQGLIGVYVKEPLSEYYKREVIRRP